MATNFLVPKKLLVPNKFFVPKMFWYQICFWYQFCLIANKFVGTKQLFKFWYQQKNLPRDFWMARLPGVIITLCEELRKPFQETLESESDLSASWYLFSNS